jgi:thiosulfate reductase cytochrome b subunit
MEDRIYLYAVWTRIWHWLNAIFFILLIFTGLSMHYAAADSFLIPFQTSVIIHNVCGIGMVLGFVFFVLANLFTWNGKYYNIRWKGYGTELWKQIRYYAWGIFNHEAKPFPITKKRKFNPLQQLSYVIAMYILVPLIVISGLGLLFPETTITTVMGRSGLWLTDLLHQITGFFLTVFWLIHLYFCTIGKTPTSNFKSMVDGWH